jgi:hypothetical protein
MVAHADKYARSAKIIGNSTRDMANAYGDALAISKTPMRPIRRRFIAKMKFANKALYGEAEGGDHDRALMDLMKTIEFRGGTKNEAAFAHQAEYAQKIITHRVAVSMATKCFWRSSKAAPWPRQ